MAIATPADLPRFAEARRDGERLVGELDHAEHAAPVVLHGEAPTGRVRGRAQRPHAALSEAQETATEAGSAQVRSDGVEGEALRDAAEIDRHAHFVEPSPIAPTERVEGAESDGASHEPDRRRDLGFVRNDVPLDGPGPEGDERADGHVEGATCQQAGLFGANQQGVHPTVDLDVAPACPRVQAANVALLDVPARDALEAGDRIEGRRERLACPPLFTGPHQEREVENGAHHQPAVLDGDDLEGSRAAEDPGRTEPDPGVSARVREAPTDPHRPGDPTPHPRSSPGSL